MRGDHRERLAGIYEELPRDQLAQAGRQFLEGNLHLRARSHRRWLWLAGMVFAVFAVFMAILLLVYLLEKTKQTADGFKLRRDEQLRQ